MAWNMYDKNDRAISHEEDIGYEMKWIARSMMEMKMLLEEAEKISRAVWDAKTTAEATEALCKEVD